VFDQFALPLSSWMKHLEFYYYLFFEHYFLPCAFKSDVIHEKPLHHIYLLALILEDDY